MSQTPEQPDPAGTAKLAFLTDKCGNRHNVVWIRRMFEPQHESKPQHKNIGRFGHQQILGDCSPDSMSTMRLPPMRVLIKTRPGWSGCTSPMITDSRPDG